MRIITAFVASLNGKTTKGDNPDVHGWASQEDGEHFRRLLQEAEVVIVGRKTYETMELKPEPGKLRIVFTFNPAKYQTAQVKGQLEFTNEPSRAVMARVRAGGYTSVLVAAGAQVASLFLDAGLIDELYLTIEPLLFSKGNPLFQGAAEQIDLHLLAVQQLNGRGSLLAHYQVIKD